MSCGRTKQGLLRFVNHVLFLLFSPDPAELHVSFSCFTLQHDLTPASHLRELLKTFLTQLHLSMYMDINTHMHICLPECKFHLYVLACVLLCRHKCGVQHSSFSGATTTSEKHVAQQPFLPVCFPPEAEGSMREMSACTSHSQSVICGQQGHLKQSVASLECLKPRIL